MGAGSHEAGYPYLDGVTHNKLIIQTNQRTYEQKKQVLVTYLKFNAKSPVNVISG